jgi:hypothetical protein
MFPILSDNRTFMNRRRFLGACSAAACAARGLDAASGAAPEPGPPTRVRVVFSHPGKPIEGWPYKGFDYEARKRELLTPLRQACKGIEFLPVSVTSTEDGQKVLAADAEVDGYLVWLLGIPSPAPPLFAALQRPVVAVNDFYGGGLGVMRGPRVAAISSSNFGDVVDGVRAIDCTARLRRTVLLDITERSVQPMVEAFKKNSGLTVNVLPGEVLGAAYEKAGMAEARQFAKTWMDGAQRIAETNEPEIVRSGRMYHAMRSLMREHNAAGIAVDCLHLFYGGKLAAYPCLGFCQLNDDGLVGACEADINSAFTMLTATYLTGRPGYISDPVMDTANNQVIYAHCVAPTKVFGPQGTVNPYEIRSHSEDRKGASLRSLLPLNEKLTTLIMAPAAKKMILHTAKSVSNLDDDKACRTKLVAEVANARKLFKGWTQGWHRVTVYGDHRDRFETLAQLLGFEFVEEG